MITFSKEAVVIDPDPLSTLKNKEGKNAPDYNHMDGKRKQNAHKKFKSTGPIDKDGNPIKDGDDSKDSASQIHEDHQNHGDHTPKKKRKDF